MQFFSDLSQALEDLSFGRLPGSLLGNLLTYNVLKDFLEVFRRSLLPCLLFHYRSECFGKFLCLIFLHLITSGCSYLFLKLKLSNLSKSLRTWKHQTLYQIYHFLSHVFRTNSSCFAGFLSHGSHLLLL